MRKFFYTIGVLLFFSVFIFGYCQFYEIADVRDRIWLLENSQKKQTVKKTENSKLFSETSLPGETVLAEGNTEDAGYGPFFLKAEKDYVIVYLSDKETIYETSSIRFSSLPAKIREEIKAGKYLKNQQELYSFLENYSS